MKKKINKNNKSNDLDQRAIDKLLKAAEAAGKKNQIKSFIEGLLTESERLMLGRRLLIAELLLSGQSQAEVIYKYKISPNTVWRINKWLISEFPEYGQILKQTTGVKEKYEKKREGKTFANNNHFTFAGLRRAYPGHFLLFDLVENLLKK